MALKWNFANATWRTLLFTVLFAALATALMQAVRLSVIEPEMVGASCAANSASLLCQVRGALVYGFTNDIFGITSIVAALFATLIRWRWVAAVAVFVGVIGAVLYRFELSGVGLLLGALVLVRPRHVEPASQTQQV